MARRWRPTSEADAASDIALFVEWLRATGQVPEATGPEDLPPGPVGGWLEAYLSAGGDPERAAALRAEVMLRVWPSRDAP